jgi:hypothetical protein
MSDKFKENLWYEEMIQKRKADPKYMDKYSPATRYSLQQYEANKAQQDHEEEPPKAA